ncbi:phage major capsid protein [Clostridium tagluense]|uniref:phage major capsid protein n=1 Tax=Clostridium tagluense TaxID=360422 RepID=UPI001C6E7246|nr:phage major capsid protein [Clostridium tagluense]MBW9154866.1 phage major capsid protein [Clostridium tagluense]WLC64321.1 phage major capsid protein [Clostridium tagluense]
MLKSQELHAKLVEVKANAKDLIVASEITAKITEIEDIKAQILMAEMSENEERIEAEKAIEIQNKTKNKDGVEDMVNKGYREIFAKAIIGTATSEELKTISNLMVEGDKGKGGIAIGEDISKDIKVFQDARRMFDVRNLINVEPVGTLKGSRPYVTNQPEAQGFASVDEGKEVQALYEPTFDDMAYLVRSYAGFIPLTKELLADDVTSIYNFIVKWLGENELNTYAYQVFNGTGTKSAQGIMTETKVGGALISRTEKLLVAPTIKKFKTTFNVDLEALVNGTETITTNSDGYDYLDGLEDKNGKAYLQADATSLSGYKFLGRDIFTVPKKFLANVVDGVDTLTPFLMGDLKQIYTMFDREQMVIESTKIGGDAWRSRKTEAMGDFRFDGKIIPSNLEAIKIILAKLG